MMEQGTYVFRGIPLPKELRESIDAYVKHGRLPGDFLTACIENDLAGAFGHADERSLAAMAAVVGYLYNECPSQCWGSKGVAKSWTDLKREEASQPHNLLIRAIGLGAARWELFTESKSRGEVCCGGMRYATELDKFGVPVINGVIRHALEEAIFNAEVIHDRH